MDVVVVAFFDSSIEEVSPVAAAAVVVVAAAVVVVVAAFPSPRQRLSKIRCNKMPPSVGYVLAGERAAVIAV